MSQEDWLYELRKISLMSSDDSEGLAPIESGEAWLGDFLQMAEGDGYKGSAAQQLGDFLRIVEGEGHKDSASRQLSDFLRMEPGEENIGGAAQELQSFRPPIVSELSDVTASLTCKASLLVALSPRPAGEAKSNFQASEAQKADLPAKASPRPVVRADPHVHDVGEAVHSPRREAAAPPRPQPSTNTGHDFVGLGGLAAASCGGARCGMLVGAPVAAVAGLLTGAASCGAGGALFAPVTFGFSAPLGAGLCAEAGLWLGAACGTAAGVAIGTGLGIALRCLGCRLNLGWSKLRIAAVTMLLTALLGPLFAAVGAWFGLYSGALLGLFAGLFCILFTAGLSVPIGIAVFAVLGSAVAAAIGALAGACVSLLIAVYRDRLIACLCPFFLQTYAAARRCWDWLAQSFVKDEDHKDDDCKGLLKPDEDQSCANYYEKNVRGARSRSRRKGGKNKPHEISRACRA